MEKAVAALDGAKYSKWFPLQGSWSLDPTLPPISKITEAQNLESETDKD